MLTLLEYVVRCELAAQGETLAGLYAGNAKRETVRPTAERLLEAFQEDLDGGGRSNPNRSTFDGSESSASAHPGAFGVFFSSVYEALRRF